MAAPKKRASKTAIESGADHGDLALAAILPEATALPAYDVRVVAIDAPLALHNARIGLASVMGEETLIAQQLARVDLATLRSVETLALAYGAATRRVDRSASTKIAPLYARASELRRIVLANAKSLAEAGVLKWDAVNRIARGRGKLDAARDCVDLAALYRANAAALKNQTPITKAQLDEMEALGAQLGRLLKPKGGKKTMTAELASALDVRDRVGTLLLARWAQLWSVGAFLFGPDAIDERVPPLLSRKRPQKKKADVVPATT